MKKKKTIGKKTAKNKASGVRNIQKRSLDTKERIIEAALLEFAMKGFEGATMRTIAKHAKVKHPQIIYHFNNKDDLWFTCADMILKKYLDKVERRFEDLKGVDAATKLKMIYKDFATFSAKYPIFHRIIVHESASNSPHLQKILDETRQVVLQIKDLIKEAQSKGDFVKGDPIFLHYMITGATSHIFGTAPEYEAVSGKDPFTGKIIEAYMNTIIDVFFSP